MFLKQSNSGFAYLQEFAESALELKKFIDFMKAKFELSEDSGLEDIQNKVEQLFREWISSSNLTSEFEEVAANLRKENNALLASIAEKELVANISSFTLYEVLSAISTLLDSRNLFLQEEDYFAYIISTLTKIKNVDLLQKGDIISSQNDEIRRLESVLERKVEDFSTLKIQIAELFSNGCAPDLANFDRDFKFFKKEIEELKIKAAKYDFLIARGAVKEVGNTLSSTGNFYLTYGKS